MSAKVPKVLIFTLDYLPKFGGVGTYLHGIAKELPSDQVAVLTNEALLEGGEAPNLPYRIDYKQLVKKRSFIAWFPAFGALARMLESFKPDVILCANILPLGLVTYWMSKVTRTPYYISLHGLDILLAQKTRRKRFITRLVLRHAKTVIVNSNYTKGLVRECMNDEKFPALVMYPCPTNEIREYPKHEARKYLHINDDDVVMLSVGRLVRRKGFERVIKVMPTVLKQLPTIKYYIIGNGPEYSRLQQLIEQNNLQSVIEIRKDVAQSVLGKYYSAADFFMMPNTKIGPDVEGFGLVFLEASLYGLPSIAGNSGGAPEAVVDGKSGMVINPESAEEIEKSILGLANDPALCNTLGEYGKTRTLEHFKCRHEVNKLVFAYNNV